MEYFVTGATLSLIGVFTLTAIGYQKGWLKRAAKQLANEAENNSRRRLLTFIQDREDLRDLIKQSNRQGEQLVSQLTSDLKSLSVRESRELAEEIWQMSNDFEGTAAELVAVCEQILQSEDNDLSPRLLKKDEEEGKQSVKNGRTGATVAETKFFDDTKQYAVMDSTTRNTWVMVTGKLLNARVAQGEIPCRDFVAMPQELCENP